MTESAEKNFPLIRTFLRAIVGYGSAFAAGIQGRGRLRRHERRRTGAEHQPVDHQQAHQDLEQRLGLTLCQRGREGFAVTDEGLLIYQETVNLLAATEAFRRGVDEVHQRMGGQLHVAIFDHTVSNPQAQIGRAIALFSERAPEVSLQMYVEPINTIERGVIDGQFQVGVIPMHRSAESLSYHSLFSERMFLYCGAQHELFSAPMKR